MIHSKDVADQIASYQTALEEIEHGLPANLVLDAQNPEIGLSGKKLIAALQRITGLACRSEDFCYVEVGTYRGLTLLSVASSNPAVPCFGIDNFSQFDPKGINESLIADRVKELGIHNVHLAKDDFEEALNHLSSHIGERKIGCYFVDGPHDYRSQLVCLMMARKYLASCAVIFIDDANYEHVRQANRDFLVAFPEFKLLFEAYGNAHPNNLSLAEHRAARDEFWNGLNILVHDPNDILEPIFPPTSIDRTRYLNEHIIHASRTPEIAPEALNLANALFSPWRLPHAIADILKQRSRWKEAWRQRFPNSNTYSFKTSRHATKR